MGRRLSQSSPGVYLGFDRPALGGNRFVIMMIVRIIRVVFIITIIIGRIIIVIIFSAINILVLLYQGADALERLLMTDRMQYIRMISLYFK